MMMCYCVELYLLNNLAPGSQ